MTEDKPAAAPAKAQKNRAPRSKNPGTPLSKLIVEAVSTSQGRGGMSVYAIKTYLRSNGVDTPMLNKRVKLTLARLVTNGTLKQVKGVGANGSFLLAKKTPEAKPARKTVTPRKLKTPKSRSLTPKQSPAKKKTTAKKTTVQKTTVKKSIAKKSVKKSPARKPAAKKTTAKKPAAKKTTAKKPAAKKTTAKKPAAKKTTKPKKTSGVQKATPTKRSRSNN